MTPYEMLLQGGGRGRRSQFRRAPDAFALGISSELNIVTQSSPTGTQFCRRWVAPKRALFRSPSRSGARSVEGDYRQFKDVTFMAMKSPMSRSAMAPPAKANSGRR